MSTEEERAFGFSAQVLWQGSVSRDDMMGCRGDDMMGCRGVVRAINTFFTLLFIDLLQIRVRMEAWNDSKMGLGSETASCLLLKGIPTLELCHTVIQSRSIQKWQGKEGKWSQL